MKWFFLTAFILASFGTLFVCVANMVSARKNGQLRANRSFTRWFNFQRLKTGREQRVLPPPVYGPAKICSICGHATSQDDPKCDDCGYDFSGSGGGEMQTRRLSSPIAEKSVVRWEAGLAPSPLPDSLNGKEVDKPTPQRAREKEAGAHDFKPFERMTIEQHNAAPFGRWSTPRN